jgi:hypothetical protein
MDRMAGASPVIHHPTSNHQVDSKDRFLKRRHNMKLAVATIASTLLAASAMAQTSNDSSSSGNASTTGTSTDATAGSSQSGSGSAMAQDKVRQQLTDAGFKQVEILDASYLVRAQTEDGNTVLMVIDPPIGSTGSSTGSGTGTTSGSGTDAGSSNSNGESND